jgi:hypothetical protein
MRRGGLLVGSITGHLLRWVKGAPSGGEFTEDRFESVPLGQCNGAGHVGIGSELPMTDPRIAPQLP